MYKFTDLNPRGEPNNSSCVEALIYNGTNLDQNLIGYQTLYVEGRDSFDVDINSADTSGNGTMYLNSRFKERELKVHFAIDAGNNVDDFNSCVDNLKNLLRTPNKSISFADNPGYSYIGTPNLEVDGGSLTPQGVITFTLNDPFQRSAIRTATGTTSVTINDPQMQRPAIPVEIDLTMNAGADKLVVSNNNGQSWSTVNGVSSGDNIRIDFKNLTYVNNKADQTGNVSLLSNFGDFLVGNGTTLTVNVACSITVKYQIVKL